MTDSTRPDLIRNILCIFLVGVMLTACFWVLRPFLPALIWAAMIVIATWPLMVKIEAKLGARRRIAVTIMMGLLVMVFVIPFALAVDTIVENAPQLTALGKQIPQLAIPDSPEWVERLPLVGEDLAAAWKNLSVNGPGGLTERLAPYIRKSGGWLVAQAGNFGMMFVHFALTMILSALLYINGEPAADMVRRFATRVAGDRGPDTAVLAAKAVRAVALGVVVTALVQSILAGIGLAIVGIPYASLLTALIFMLTIAQIGGSPVLIPAIVWLYWKGSLGWGTFLLIWSIPVLLLDNTLRPYLIRKSANLPLLLIFAGVIGGLIAFGLIGLFIGPALLAVGYTLLMAWITESGPLEMEENAIDTDELLP